MVTKYGEWGGVQNGRGLVASEVLPLQKKGGVENVLAMLTGDGVGVEKSEGYFSAEA